MVSQANELPPESEGESPSEDVSPPQDVSAPQGVSPPQDVNLPPATSVGREFMVLCYTLLSLFIIGFSVWLVFAWVGYGERYAQVTDRWHKGGTYSIEITIVREDENNLGCASDLALEGLQCAHRANRRPVQPPPDDRVLLRPYNTVDSVLFLGAGLWSSPGMRKPLPTVRFTVVCDFHMLGAVKSVATRWKPGGPFLPATKSFPFGTLSGCVWQKRCP